MITSYYGVVWSVGELFEKGSSGVKDAICPSWDAVFLVLLIEDSKFIGGREVDVSFLKVGKKVSLEFFLAYELVFTLKIRVVQFFFNISLFAFEHHLVVRHFYLYSIVKISC